MYVGRLAACLPAVVNQFIGDWPSTKAAPGTFRKYLHMYNVYYARRKDNIRRAASAFITGRAAVDIEGKEEEEWLDPYIIIRNDTRGRNKWQP